jgi:hypothetical protein
MPIVNSVQVLGFFQSGISTAVRNAANTSPLDASGEAMLSSLTAEPAPVTHAVSEYLRMESAQMAAVLDGRGFAFEAERKDALLVKQRAERAILLHEQEHGCGERAAPDGDWIS